MERLATERWPYSVAVARDGTVYVSAWGGSTVSVFTPGSDGLLQAGSRIRVGRHPSALLLNADGSRLFVASASTDRVAVVDTRQRRLLTELLDPPPGAPGEGSTPSALALSADGTRLYVVESDNNAIALLDLSPATSGVAGATGHDMIAGRVPTEWYPTAVAVRGDSLIALTGKGRGTGPNREGPGPRRFRNTAGFDPAQYTLGQTSGTLITSLLARARSADLDALTRRVARANRWGERPDVTPLPPFEHVIYIVTGGSSTH